MNFLKNFIKNNRLGIALVIFVPFLLAIPYFIQDGPPFYYNGDLAGQATHILDRAKELKSGILFNGWYESTSKPAFNVTSLFFDQILILINLAVKNIWTAYKIFQVMQIPIAGLSMYLFSYYIARKKYLPFFAAVFFMTTTYFLKVLATHPDHISWMYALLPLAYLGLEIALFSRHKYKFIPIFFSGLILFMTTFTHFYFVYYNGIFFFLYILLRILLQKFDGKDLAKKIFTGLLIFLIAIFFSSFTLIPTLLEKFPQYDIGGYSNQNSADRKGEALQGTWSPESLISVFKFDDKEFDMHAESVGSFKQIPPTLLLLEFFMSALAVSALLFKKQFNNHIHAKILATLALFAMLCVMGVNAPIFKPYVYFVNYLPLFYLFRTSVRFMLQFSFCFSFLAALASETICCKIKNTLGKRFIFLAILTPPIILFIINCFWAGPRTLMTAQIPPDLQTSINFWKNINPDNYRVLDITVSADGPDQTYHLGANSLYYGSQILKQYGDSKFIANILAEHNVKYILYNPTSCNPYLSDNPYMTISKKITSNLLTNPDFNTYKIYGDNDEQNIIINGVDKAWQVPLRESALQLVKFDKDFNVASIQSDQPNRTELAMSKDNLKISTSKYTGIIMNARTDDTNIKLFLTIHYSDGEITTEEISGFVWRSKFFKLKPDKIITKIDISIKSDKVGNMAYVGTPDLYVLENKKVLPKFYLVDNPEENLLSYHLDSSDNQNFSAILNNNIIPLEYKKISSSEYDIKVNTDSGGYLINTETYFPGWECDYNNLKLPTVPNSIKTLNSCYVDKGEHLVKLKYTQTKVRKLSYFLTVLPFIILAFVLLGKYLFKFIKQRKSRRLD